MRRYYSADPACGSAHLALLSRISEVVHFNIPYETRCMQGKGLQNDVTLVEHLLPAMLYLRRASMFPSAAEIQ